MSSTRRIILTFDAFGTLFTPRESIAKSYANAARDFGLSGFTDDQIASRFRNAFKEESSKAPNYGKKVGMGATRWWSNVIESTFSPYARTNTLPDRLIPSLLHRFSSSEGYMLYADVKPLFDSLLKIKKAYRTSPNTTELSVGIITNSDNRVPSILSSLGLKVSPLRYKTNTPDSVSTSKDGEIIDVEFVTLSYDVGFEKPNQEIFDSAKVLGNIVRGKKDQVRYIHVGDDFEKDFRAAQNAGWEGLHLDRERNNVGHIPKIGTSITTLQDLEPHLLNP